MANQRKEQDNSDSTLQSWNGFGFKFVTKLDHPLVLRHLQENWYADEPRHQILGVTSERSADLDQTITDILTLHSGSFCAYPLDDPNKIAAVIIIKYHESGKELPAFEPRSPVTTVLREMMHHLKSPYNIHKEHNVDIYPEIFIISSDKNYRGKGLAAEMYHRAINMCRSQGHKVISSTFSNPLSRKIGERLGFKPVSRLEFSESIFGEAGKQHFLLETVLQL